MMRHAFVKDHRSGRAACPRLSLAFSQAVKLESGGKPPFPTCDPWIAFQAPLSECRTRS
jgi:hypothetical protein